jgi:two-component system response regulator QseB
VRLLLVEDDPLLGEGLKMALARDGYTVDWLRNGKQALQALATDEFSVVILDLGLPGLDGIEVLTRTRAKGTTTPVLILTARDAIPDRVTGLDQGADDYLTKPFDIEELSARVRSLIRRSQGRSQPLLIHGDVQIDPAAQTLSKAGQTIDLSQKEFIIIRYLMEHKGRPISRSRLEEQLYGWDKEIESNALEVHIHNLRKKLGSDLIKTVRGVGYRLI